MFETNYLPSLICPYFENRLKINLKNAWNCIVLKIRQHSIPKCMGVSETGFEFSLLIEIENQVCCH